jgi:hypothetical protein
MSTTKASSSFNHKVTLEGEQSCPKQADWLEMVLSYALTSGLLKHAKSYDFQIEHSSDMSRRRFLYFHDTRIHRRILCPVGTVTGDLKLYENGRSENVVLAMDTFFEEHSQKCSWLFLCFILQQEVTRESFRPIGESAGE